jgi:hypothetical protein
MTRSDSITKLSAALVKAQSQVRPAVKESENPHLRSKYADLASCWDACRDALRVNGLAVLQLPGISDGAVLLETIILHESGEWLSSVMSIPVSKQDPQGYGSALTYARRYALCAALGISSEDDDGHAASHARTRPASLPPPTPGEEPAPAAAKRPPKAATIASKRDKMLARISELEAELGRLGRGDRVQSVYALMIGEERTVDEAPEDALQAYGKALRAELDVAKAA